MSNLQSGTVTPTKYPNLLAAHPLLADVTVDTTTKTIDIMGRAFTVEASTETATANYIIKGARKAEYMLVRYLNAPDFMFAMKWGGGKPFGDTMLTDRGGTLRVATRDDWKAAKAAGRVA